jgi:UDP-glucose 4-epimerase
VTTVLVTGGAGFIGSQLAERLLAEGHRVISVDDLSTGKIANLVEARGYGKEFSFFNMDVRAEGLASQFERHRPEVVFHLAAQAGVRPSLTDPVHDASVNIMGLLNVLEASVHIGARKVIYAASGGTMYGEPRRLPTKETAAQGSRPLSPYGVSKKVALDYLSYYQRYRGLDYTAVALANVYGPRQDPTGEAGVVAIFTSKMLTGEAPTIFGDGNQTRDFVYVADVAAANPAAAAIKDPRHRVYNIGTGIEVSILDLARATAVAAGVDPRSVPPLPAPARPGEVFRSCLDVRRAAAELELGRPVPLVEGLHRTLEWITAR